MMTGGDDVAVFLCVCVYDDVTYVYDDVTYIHTYIENDDRRR